MAKRPYRAVPIQRISHERVLEAVGDGKAIVGVDLAKKKIVASFADERGHVGLTVRFDHPKQTMDFVRHVEAIAKTRQVDAVLEATGTYGDAIRYQLAEHGAHVFSISAKKVHDAAEVFDGVPSLHDAKACAVMTHLHVHRAARPFEPPPAAQRDMRALIKRREIYAGPHKELLGRIEAELARHWPRGLEVLDHWQRKSALVLLAAFPDPRLIQAQPEAAAELLHTSSRKQLKAPAIQAILAAAHDLVGQAMTPFERETLSEYATEAVRLHNRIKAIDKEIEAKANADQSATHLASTVGSVTAAVLVAYLGALDDYDCPAALEKACGLNLKIRQSGESKKGRIAISKRGHGIVRRYLFMSALRLIQHDPVIRAWYQRRLAYRNGYRIAAVVAVMRKLVRALWHVARGAPFDANKLVDRRRLEHPT